MKAGEILIKKFGLEEMKNVKIARVLLSTYRIYYVFYDSHLKNSPITPNRIRKSRRVASIFSGGQFTNKNSDSIIRYTPMAPPFSIREFGGDLGANTLIIAIDLAGDRFVNDRGFTNKISESLDKECKIKVLHNNKLEELTVYDLIKNQGLSNFTKYYKMERGRVMGSETRSTKLIDLTTNKREDWIQFDFLSEATEKYASGHKYTEVDPDGFRIIPNRSKTYTFSIRILNFYEWLGVFDIDEEVTVKDLKDILDVADIQIWDSSVAFNYQGMNYYLSQANASIHPINIPPTKWNNYKNKYTGETHGGQQRLTKMGQLIVNQFLFYRNLMVAKINKVLKDEGTI